MIVEAGFGILIGAGIASVVFAYHNKDDQTGIDNEHPPVKTKTPIPEVKLPNDTISEPVISFVECVRKNPKRFKVTLEETDNTDSRWNIQDKLTKETHSILYVAFSKVGFFGPSFTTNHEARYLFTEISKIYRGREKRYKELKNQRERRRLTKIYKESV